MIPLAAPEGSLARIAALTATALVATLSLMPHLAVPDAAPRHTDLLIHLTMQGTVGFTLIWGWPRKLWWLLPALGLLVIVLEVGQTWVPGRSFSWADLIINVVGAASGAGLAHLFAGKTHA